METPLNELMNLSGKTALVTGAGGGIGKSIASRLHEAGANVMVVDLHHDNVWQAANELNERRPDSAMAVHADVSKAEDVEAAVSQTVERFGGVDILVNNAGIFPVHPLTAMTEDDFMRVIDVNLRSVFLFTKKVSAHMIETNRKGVVINVSSIDALHPSMVGLAHYDASKHGVWGFTKNVALELSQYGIRVNALAPGGVATPGVAAMSSGVSTQSADEMRAMQEQFLARIPLHRMAEPDEMGRVAVFLASDMSSYVTGSQIVVDGGALLM